MELLLKAWVDLVFFLMKIIKNLLRNLIKVEKGVMGIIDTMVVTNIIIGKDIIIGDKIGDGIYFINRSIIDFTT